jgi:hypothetical protein
VERGLAGGTQFDGTLPFSGLGNSEGWNSAVPLGQRSPNPASPDWVSSALHQQTPSGRVEYDVDTHFATIFPSVEGADWRRGNVNKFGCMDLCTFNGQQLHVFKKAEDLFPDGHCQFEPPR